MIKYHHTQIGYLMLVVTLSVLSLFAWVYITALNEPPSVNSGPNFLFSAIMVLIIFILVSFITLSVSIDENFLRIKFGYGIFAKTFALSHIVSVRAVKNHWYCGWGIRYWVWPRMWIYNVSGFDAVEIKMRNGRIFRIGTDEPQKLADTITDNIIEM